MNYRHLIPLLLLSSVTALSSTAALPPDPRHPDPPVVNPTLTPKELPHWVSVDLVEDEWEFNQQAGVITYTATFKVSNTTYEYCIEGISNQRIQLKDIRYVLPSTAAAQSKSIPCKPLNPTIHIDTVSASILPKKYQLFRITVLVTPYVDEPAELFKQILDQGKNSTLQLKLRPSFQFDIHYSSMAI